MLHTLGIKRIFWGAIVLPRIPEFFKDSIDLRLRYHFDLMMRSNKEKGYIYHTSSTNLALFKKRLSFHRNLIYFISFMQWSGVLDCENVINFF